MRDETAGADLLQVARDALLAEVLPGLAGPQRYAALMVANALKMVEREIAVNGHLRAADRTVQAFAGPAGNTDELAKALGNAIRAGRHDGNPRLYQALHARAIQAVAITRPDILTPTEVGDAMKQTSHLGGCQWIGNEIPRPPQAALAAWLTSTAAGFGEPDNQYGKPRGDWAGSAAGREAGRGVPGGRRQ